MGTKLIKNLGTGFNPIPNESNATEITQPVEQTSIGGLNPQKNLEAEKCQFCEMNDRIQKKQDDWDEETFAIVQELVAWWQLESDINNGTMPMHNAEDIQDQIIITEDRLRNLHILLRDKLDENKSNKSKNKKSK